MSRLVLVTLALAGAGACSNCAGTSPPPVEPPPSGKPSSPWYEPPGSAPGTPPPRPPGPPAAAPDLPGSSRHSRDLGRCRILPADNVWNRDISQEPVDPASDRYLRAMNADKENLHPDFGSNPAYGIPWFTVARRAPRAKMQFKYDEESDPGPYPFPADAPVEGGADADGDRHVIAIDREECKLYEGFNCWFQDTAWACESGAVFDLHSNRLRPQGWTSADAAGLPIFPGLVRRDEVLAGEIKHALRFTVRRTQRAYVFPATHFASPDRDPNLPPLGLRVRLKASFDLAPYSGHARVILAALKKYGMILADNGADWFISGEANPRWEDDQLEMLKRVPASAFEVVRLGKIQR